MPKEWDKENGGRQEELAVHPRPRGVGEDAAKATYVRGMSRTAAGARPRRQCVSAACGCAAHGGVSEREARVVVARTSAEREQ